MKRPLSPVILRFDTLPSTNTEAARQAVRGAPEGLCIVAREQTQGRGRRERVWLSPMDAGLYFSIVLRPEPLAMAGWPLITLMTALAVRDALREACALEVDIKWPNDIIVNERKLCGILAETIETERGRACIVGIGINLDDRAFPPELLETATSIAAVTKEIPDVESLLPALTQAITRRYETLLAPDGQAEIVRAWVAASSYAHGCPVRVQLEGETIEGLTRGLEPDGALRVETEQGEIRIVRAGEVTSLRVTDNRKVMSDG